MKKMRRIILLILISIFTITGCGKKINNDEGVKEFLKETFPGEKFEIISKKTITDIGDLSGGCNKDHVEGLSYQIKSLDTDITFNVYDTYMFNSYVCKYKIKSDYLEIAKNKFLEENTDYKLETDRTCLDCWEIKIDTLYYSATPKKEIKQTISNLVNELKNTYPFKHESVKSRIHILIDGDSANDWESLDNLTEERIDEIVENLY